MMTSYAGFRLHIFKVVRSLLFSHCMTLLASIQSLLCSHCMIDRRQKVSHCMTLQWEKLQTTPS